MKKHFPLLIATFVLCLIGSPAFAQGGSRLATKIEGSWKLTDVSARLEEKEATEEDRTEFAQMQNEITAMREMMKDKIEFIFKKDGTYTAINRAEGNDTENGTWKLQGELLTLKSNNDASSDILKAKVRQNILELEMPEGAIILVLKLTKQN